LPQARPGCPARELHGRAFLAHGQLLRAAAIMNILGTGVSIDEIHLPHAQLMVGVAAIRPLPLPRAGERGLNLATRDA